MSVRPPMVKDATVAPMVSLGSIQKNLRLFVEQTMELDTHTHTHTSVFSCPIHFLFVFTAKDD